METGDAFSGCAAGDARADHPKPAKPESGHRRQATGKTRKAASFPACGLWPVACGLQSPLPHFAAAGGCKMISVTSGGANSRMGGPHVPVPRLTYSSEPPGSSCSPAV